MYHHAIHKLSKDMIYVIKETVNNISDVCLNTLEFLHHDNSTGPSCGTVNSHCMKMALHHNTLSPIHRCHNEVISETSVSMAALG